MVGVDSWFIFSRPETLATWGCGRVLRAPPENLSSLLIEEKFGDSEIQGVLFWRIVEGLDVA